uniref:RNA helicase n=1 Tax=Pelodiscus sinensis TaxID=13735 RepID=K7GEL7_PELSI
MELRDYQWEVILPALEGQNIIIWLPTGAGKTRAAAYVCKRHLETRERAKVAVLVNRVHLVDQHYQQEFRALQDRFQVTEFSGQVGWPGAPGGSALPTGIPGAAGSLPGHGHQDPDMHVELTDFSLLVIDECHHTHKDAVYNRIMEDYLERKLKGQKKLPQILGLTASPSTGGASTFQGARQHILQICANLDTAKIMSSQKHRRHLEAQIPQPKKQYDVSQERPQDPFGRKLKEIMAQIHQRLDVPEVPQDFGTQVYEQRIVELRKAGGRAPNSPRRVVSIHHVLYWWDSLLQGGRSRVVVPEGPFHTLDEFYLQEKATKTLQNATEGFLIDTFDENRGTLRALADDARYENPKLSKLEKILLERFHTPGSARGIIFTKTRQSAHALYLWIRENTTLTGAGYSNQTKHMTQNEQQDVINQFRKGAFNLLVSTSVAEEGLDIPECNIVVRYGLMTNEIAMVQARGRARAEDSLYSVLAQANSKEVSRERRNETLEELMQRAIEAVQAMPEEEYRDTITDLQRSAIISRKVKKAESHQKRRLHDPDAVRLHCGSCHVAVCHGNDLRTVEKMHHVNINPNFKFYYRATSGQVEIPRNFKDWKPGGSISCANCGQAWGMEMIYRSVTLPMLSIKNFVVATPDGNKEHKKWSGVTFAIEEFDYEEYCSSTFDLDI